MERINYRITLDAHRNGIQRTLQGFETSDVLARRISVNLVAGSDTFELPMTNVVAMMYVTTPSATEPSINACTIEGNTIIYDVLPIVEEGITEMQLKVIETSVKGAKRVLISPRFAVEVTESGTNDDDAEQNVTFSAMEDAIARADAVYGARLLRVEIGQDCTFRAYYADGTVYENYYLKDALYNGNALLSKSYAMGGTGVRAGENTDNSKYYSNVSKSASIDANLVSEEARTMLDEARLQTSFTSFNVNFKTGNLDYLSANYYFDVNEEDGNLEVENDGFYNPEDIIGSVVDEYIAEKTADYNRRITQNATDIESLEGSVEVIREDISTIGDDVEAIKEDISSVEQGLRDTDENVQSLFDKNEDLEGKDIEIEGKLNQLSNPNLLINGDFQIWQEGESFTFTADGKQHYCAEMWWISSYAGTVTRVANGLKMSASDYIAQFIETPLKTGEDYTVSYQKNNGEIVVKHIIGGEYVHEWGKDNIKYWKNGNGYEGFQIFLNGGDVINWVKLEKGSIATPFVARSWHEEWLKCQRYYQTCVVIPSKLYSHSDGTFMMAIILRHVMRASPTYNITYIEYYSHGQGKSDGYVDRYGYCDAERCTPIIGCPSGLDGGADTMLCVLKADARIYPTH